MKEIDNLKEKLTKEYGRRWKKRYTIKKNYPFGKKSKPRITIKRKIEKTN